jgi:biopolymer transport protein TolQ
MARTISAPVTGVDAASVSGTVDGVTGFSGAASSADLSFVSLFINAEPLVLFIMIGLVAMSVASWAVIIEKFTTLRAIADKTSDFESEFWSAKSLNHFYDRLKKRRAKHPLAIIFSAAMEEWLRAKPPERIVKTPGIPNDTITISQKARISQMMAVSCNREIDRLERGLGFLATCGSSAPFIGLLGTTIGIINAFRSIASSQNTSLAVVAPGIAEALFATAIGLAVAIPAVIAYNKFTHAVTQLSGRFEDFSTEFDALLSRQDDARNQY